MGKKILKIDYEKLMPGDVVVTGGRGFFGFGIRWVTAGFKKRHDKDSPTHVGIVAEWGGQKFIVEMLSSGIEINPFSRYTGEESSRRWVIDIVRNEYISKENREAINRELAAWYRRKLERKYDWRGVIAFLPTRVKHSQEKYFCSELAAYMWEHIGRVPGSVKPSKVAPSDFLPGVNTIRGIKGVDWLLNY